MVFAHDTEVALAAAVALVNTLDGPDDHLTDLAALDRFVEAWGWTGTRTHDAAELRRFARCGHSFAHSGTATRTRSSAA